MTTPDFTMRERIADWISGGKLRKARTAIRLANKAADDARQAHHRTSMKFCDTCGELA